MLNKIFTIYITKVNILFIIYITKINILFTVHFNKVNIVFTIYFSKVNIFTSKEIQNQWIAMRISNKKYNIYFTKATSK
jgi:hypothetical protein